MGASHAEERVVGWVKIAEVVRLSVRAAQYASHDSLPVYWWGGRRCGYRGELLAWASARVRRSRSSRAA